jgi:hypothetical protein
MREREQCTGKEFNYGALAWQPFTPYFTSGRFQDLRLRCKIPQEEDHFNTSLIATQKSPNFFFLVQLQDKFFYVKERKVKTMIIIFVYASILILI